MQDREKKDLRQKNTYKSKSKNVSTGKTCVNAIINIPKTI